MENLDSKKFYVVGNNLALDFVNSIMFELNADELLGWTVASGLVEERKADTLRRKWSKYPLDSILKFRLFLRQTVVKLTEKREISQADIRAINAVLREKSGYLELRKNTEGFTKGFEIDLGDPGKVLVPITESFVDLLCYGNLDYLRICENPNCMLYFYDTTKNHRRRWCSMAVCGNRAKAAKFYRKKRAGGIGNSIAVAHVAAQYHARPVQRQMGIVLADYADRPDSSGHGS